MDHLGERCVRNTEVEGSNPFGATKNLLISGGIGGFCLVFVRFYSAEFCAVLLRPKQDPYGKNLRKYRALGLALPLSFSAFLLRLLGYEAAHPLFASPR